MTTFVRECIASTNHLILTYIFRILVKKLIFFIGTHLKYALQIIVEVPLFYLKNEKMLEIHFSTLFIIC